MGRMSFKAFLAALLLVALTVSPSAGAQTRKLNNWPFDTTANSAATAVNNGKANDGVFAKSGANAQGYGWGSTTANSQAAAVDNGIVNGPVVANSVVTPG